MIFLAGIHGAGKTTFCSRVEKELGVKCWSASGLIEAVVKQRMPENKEIKDIGQNQRLLEYAVRILGISGESILMEGHLCLLNEYGEIVRIPSETFDKLQIRGIVVLIDDIAVIAGRNRHRSRLLASAEFIDAFQREELSYGQELCEGMRIPFYIIENSEDGFHEFRKVWKELQKS